MDNVVDGDWWIDLMDKHDDAVAKGGKVKKLDTWYGWLCSM